MAVVRRTVTDALKLGAIRHDAIRRLARCQIERRPQKLSRDAHATCRRRPSRRRQPPFA
jgi:hypothetical protein